MSEYIITRYDNPDELIHYGIPGMKWGHRKSQYYETVGNRYHTRAANKAQNKVNRLNSSDQTAKAALVSKESRKARLWLPLLLHQRMELIS